MKTMTCKQLGGACDLEFQAETFEEIASDIDRRILYRTKRAGKTQRENRGDQ